MATRQQRYSIVERILWNIDGLEIGNTLNLETVNALNQMNLDFPDNLVTTSYNTLSINGVNQMSNVPKFCFDWSNFDKDRLKTTKDNALLAMGYYGLLQEGWRFKFSPRAKKRLGVCKFIGEIELSKYYISNSCDYIDIQDTILHEIGHALLHPKVKHGPAWKALGNKIGYSPERLASTKEVKQDEHFYFLRCSKCKKECGKFYKAPKRKYFSNCCSSKRTNTYTPIEWRHGKHHRINDWFEQDKGILYSPEYRRLKS